MARIGIHFDADTGKVTPEVDIAEAEWAEVTRAAKTFMGELLYRLPISIQLRHEGHPEDQPGEWPPRDRDDN